MFFYISKILSSLFFIYPLFIFFSFLAAWRMRPGWLRRFYFLFWLIVYLCSSNYTASILMRSLENQYPYTIQQEIPEADAILLLGGMVHPLAGRDPERPEFLGSVDRVLMAEELLHARKAPMLVISGGHGLMMQEGPREADLLASFLIQRGISSEQLMIESQSRNTAENARQIARLAQGQGWRRVLLITSAFHMPRAMACFAKLREANQLAGDPGVDFDMVAVPVDYYASTGFGGPESILPTPGAMLLSTLALKEYLGFLGYWIRGYI